MPVFLYEARYGFTKDFEEKEEQIESNVYIVFIFFKLFKLLMLSRISQSLSYVGDLLSDRFVTKKIKVENIMGYVRAAGSFCIMIHIFSCAWIYIGALDDQWMDDEEKLFEDKPSTYVNSIYFITTTMTSVGYGDISGKNEHSTTLLFIIFTAIFGILGFTIVKMFVFSAQLQPTIQDIVKKAEDDTEAMLFRID